MPTFRRMQNCLILQIFIYPGIPKAPIPNESESSPNDGRTYGGSKNPSLDGLNIV